MQKHLVNSNFFRNFAVSKKRGEFRILITENTRFNSCNGRLWYLHHQRRNVLRATSRLRQRETYQFVNLKKTPSEGRV